MHSIGRMEPFQPGRRPQTPGPCGLSGCLASMARLASTAESKPRLNSPSKTVVEPGGICPLIRSRMSANSLDSRGMNASLSAHLNMLNRGDALLSAPLAMSTRENPQESCCASVSKVLMFVHVHASDISLKGAGSSRPGGCRRTPGMAHFKADGGQPLTYAEEAALQGPAHTLSA